MANGDPTASGDPLAVGPRAPWIGLVSALVLMAGAMLVPALADWNVHVRHFPPLHADWDPRVGAGTAPAILLAALAAWQAGGLARTLRWRTLLLASYVSGVAWMLALAWVDGSHGISAILGSDYEYLRTARATDDLPATLREYVDRIPFDAPGGNWPVHIAGHPPGALTFFVGLVRLGLGSGFAAGMVVTLLAASTALAVLITLRVLGAEEAARRAAPFLVFGPAAIWQCVSADGMFAAFVAWGAAALAVAATSAGTVRSTVWGGVAGLLLGYAVMLSYGLPLAGVLAVAVLVVARSWRPLLPAVVAASAVVLAYAALGYSWWEAIPVLRERYWDGVAHVRPGAYWTWANLAALCFSAGPMVGAAVAATVSRARDGVRSGGQLRVVTWLTGAGIVMVLAADLSQMSRAEVERIWLPFVPWLLVGCALLPERWRRHGLMLQLVAALAVQHLLATGW
ncbi:hypothetical protein [Marmoricola sp. RAF53]|uniref:hypothetical protein n=1 Tax=Marmoricola sp. RAF53 TaxID=3233059 RepID=UPI003F9E9FB1